MTKINVTEALDRFDNDRDIYGELVDTFVKAGSADLDELKRFVAEENLAEVCSRAHRIKGAALTLGADELAQVAATLEGHLRSGIRNDSGALVAELETSYIDTLAALRIVQDTFRKPS
jgi:HPt (histidine-containing phosphotransfer) domain-containing protein